MKNIFLLLGLLFAFVNAEAKGIEEIIRGNAKFNAVATVLIIIFCGIVFFLFRMDRRLTKIENQKKDQK
jgi:CcmD family protein